MSTGQWFVSGDGTPWWFDSGSLCLDFAYTGSMSENRAGEKLNTPADLNGWLSQRFERLQDVTADGELRDAIALRRAIGAIARTLNHGATPAADDVDTINLFAATPNIPPVLTGGNRQAGRSSVRAGQALATIARDAVGLFTGGGGGRLRECAAGDCALIFFDESRSNNRRWCSMQRCGNRSKVRAHRARAAP